MYNPSKTNHCPDCYKNCRGYSLHWPSVSINSIYKICIWNIICNFKCVGILDGDSIYNSLFITEHSRTKPQPLLDHPKIIIFALIRCTDLMMRLLISLTKNCPILLIFFDSFLLIKTLYNACNDYPHYCHNLNQC